MELGKGEPLSKAALRSGMSETTARRYRAGDLRASASSRGSTGHGRTRSLRCGRRSRRCLSRRRAWKP
jgi:hypothetical protein